MRQIVGLLILKGHGSTKTTLMQNRKGFLLSKVFLGSMLPQYMALSVRLFRFVSSKKIKEHCQLLYDIARLHLMVPIDFWQDPTTFG